MNWRSVKLLSEDDYDKPLLLRVRINDFYRQNYVSGYITPQRKFVSISIVKDSHFMAVDGGLVPDDAYFIRIDEIKD